MIGNHLLECFDAKDWICLLHDRDADVDVETAGLAYVNMAPKPRIIKSHLSFELLPPNLLDKAKVSIHGI